MQGGVKNMEKQYQLCLSHYLLLPYATLCCQDSAIDLMLPRLVSALASSHHTLCRVHCMKSEPKRKKGRDDAGRLADPSGCVQGVSSAGRTYLVSRLWATFFSSPYAALEGS